MLRDIRIYYYVSAYRLEQKEIATIFWMQARNSILIFKTDIGNRWEQTLKSIFQDFVVLNTTW